MSLAILQHALGLDQYGHGRGGRNRYVTTDGSSDFSACTVHVTGGRMTRHGPSELFGGKQSYCFVVTDFGRRVVAETSPAPPKQTRGQYQEWLRVYAGKEPA